MSRNKKARRKRRDILGLDSGERDGREEQPLQSQFAAGGVVPFGGGVRAAAFSAAAERDGGDVEREGNVRVGGTAFEARAIAEKAVHVADVSSSAALSGNFPAGREPSERTITRSVSFSS